ncbi:hypothetical protein SAMN05216503_3248 [Polaribacter sp. KT25b]|uniref:hypothetical protein n=1 Tax=Polaribacter sp. KT25b TaxID=1855336 RepID=UPI00087CEC33|nr:hypothetical protein [Polaribacter sp. KT25b]SDS49692.1 hypothetical protein SAMN05216503_3248 [Polaribacter sp. KT25b]
MKLSEIQIDELYKFTRQHYVYHYDVQSELVDHLANDIEEIWVEYSNLSFEQAREKSFKKFGIFGFMDVIEAKQKQMNKRYRKIYWRFFKEWFTVPKILLTISLFLAFIIILKNTIAIYFILGITFIYILYDLFYLARARKRNKKKIEKQEKIFLLEAMIRDTRSNFTGLNLLNILNMSFIFRYHFNDLAFHWLLLLALFFTIAVISIYINNKVIPQKAEELLQETYPEYKLVKKL